jgi:hypothetical protein
MGTKRSRADSAATIVSEEHLIGNLLREVTLEDDTRNEFGGFGLLAGNDTLRSESAWAARTAGDTIYIDNVTDIIKNIQR